MDFTTLYHRDIVEAVAAIKPDAGFNVVGNSIVWHEPVENPPTRQQIEAAVTQHLAAKRLANTEAEIATHADAVTDQVLGGYPLAERLSFDRKASAADAYLAGTATSLQRQIIEDEAAVTGESPSVLAANITSKTARYSKVASVIAGHRRSTVSVVRGLGSGASDEALEAAVNSYRTALALAVAEALAQ